jgi:hypothetical protein
MNASPSLAFHPTTTPCGQVYIELNVVCHMSFLVCFVIMFFEVWPLLVLGKSHLLKRIVGTGSHKGLGELN